MTFMEKCQDGQIRQKQLIQGTNNKTGKLLRLNCRVDGAKSRLAWEENPLTATKGLMVRRRFTLQFNNNNPKHTATATMERFKPSQSLDLNAT